MVGVRECVCDADHQVAVLHSLAIPIQRGMSRLGVLVGMLVGIFVSFVSKAGGSMHQFQKSCISVY